MVLAASGESLIFGTEIYFNHLNLQLLRKELCTALLSVKFLYACHFPSVELSSHSLLSSVFTKQTAGLCPVRNDRLVFKTLRTTPLIVRGQSNNAFANCQNHYGNKFVEVQFPSLKEQREQYRAFVNSSKPNRAHKQGSAWPGPAGHLPACIVPWNTQTYVQY